MFKKYTAILILSMLSALLIIGAAQAAQGPELQTVTLAVENMTCSMCPITIRKSLEKVPGVTKAKADFETKTATVTFDPKKTNIQSLTQATTNAGYPSVLKPDDQ